MNEQQNNKAKGLSIASLVCSILGILSTCCCACLGLPFPIAAIILGFLAKDEYGNRNGMATAGIIIGFVGVVIALGTFIFNLISGTGNQVMESLQSSFQ